MAAKGGDSKNGLIVALVIAILFVISLGVATYYGYAGQEDLAKKEKASRDAETAAKRNRDWNKLLALLNKAYLGTATKNELAELGTLRGNLESLGKGETNFAENKNAMEKMERPDYLGWNLGESRPAVSALEKIANLENQVANLLKALEAEKTNVMLEKGKVKQAEDAAATQRDTFRKNVDALNQKYLALEAAKWKEFTDMQAAFAGETKRVEDIQKQAAAKQEEFDKVSSKQGAELKDAELRGTRAQRERDDLEKDRDRLQGKIDPVNVREVGPARGKVVRLDRSGTVAWINVGTADNVKPQVRFSIFQDKGNGTPTGDLKGSAQVTEVTGDHMAKVQITYTRDPNHNPILPGDLLFNPTWSPASREHVAVAGLIDLTGLGTDNTAEFVRSLERLGVTVDAYLDLKELAVKGKGMTIQTTYLIVGDRPTLDAQGALQDKSKVEAVQNINDKVSQLTEEAVKLGVQVIPYRRYLTLTGFRAPRAPNDPLSPAPVTPRYAPAKKEAPPEAKPVPKDDGKNGK